MKKLTTSILACGLLASGLLSASAAASLRVSNDGGVTWIEIDDNGPLDTDPTVGVVEFDGPIGNWTLSISSGQSDPFAGSPATPDMDLFTLNGSSQPASLIVQYCDADLPTFASETYAHTVLYNTGGTVIENAYRDSGNVVFGTTQTYPGGPAGTSPSPTALLLSSVGPVSGMNTYSNGMVVLASGNAPNSLTIETIINHAGNARTSTDTRLYALPQPPCNCTLTFNSPSAITNCPGDTIPDVTASEDCGGPNGLVPVVVTFAGAVTNGTCPAIITRTNTATDDCGNLHTFVQTITLNCKADCTVTTSVTNGIAGTAGYTAWVADAGPNAIYYWTVANATITAGQGTTNITWTAGPDATKQATICVQITTAAGCVSQCCAYVPLTPPCRCSVTFNVPASITNCPGDTIPPVTASEDCGSGPVPVSVKFAGAVTNGSCPTIITRTNTAVDDCGKLYTFVQTVKIFCKPDCTITPSVTTTTVGATNTASVVNAGSGATYLWSISNGSIVSGQGTTTLTWKAGTDTNNPVTIYITITTAIGCQSSCWATVKIMPPPPSFGKGDAATMGFWHNKNGQGLITNAPSGPPTLANWLAGNFPCLYGSLANKSNTDVANFFLTKFNGTAPKTDAQVMSVALASYFTSTSLGGGPGPVKFGFNQSPGGTGAKLYNVGSNGAFFGVPNNTSLTILQLLQGANAWRCANPTAAWPTAINDLFNNINTGGDIT